MKHIANKEPKIDCFAYCEEGKSCSALTELVCIYENKCHFYKHENDVNIKDINKAIKNYSGPTHLQNKVSIR